MITKYYYNCPIKALWMMQEFGVQFKHLHESYIGEGVSIALEGLQYILKSCDGALYVSKESEYIFTPQLDDLVDRADPYPHNNIYKAKAGDIRAFSTSEWPLNIIMREGKQFFMPEVS